ncbi:hypothetical protein [Bradyrhizobium sp. NAS96.2]|uniref:hypothetical protein n=1 Tax=Bradyrhizobium sp. NAS96.2 TaxID=1680160 RepID=UPI00143D1AF9|nr:hypothetical protein [Bradyrhizobium sp. NAS96.2]
MNKKVHDINVTDGCAKLLNNFRNAEIRADPPHGVGEDVDAAQHLSARLGGKFDILGSHRVSPSSASCVRASPLIAGTSNYQVPVLPPAL